MGSTFFYIYDLQKQPRNVHSLRLFLWRLFNFTTTQRRSRHSRPTDTVSEFHAKAPQATASERLSESPYVAARARFEQTTLRTKSSESTNEPPRPTPCHIVSLNRPYGPSMIHLCVHTEEEGVRLRWTHTEGVGSAPCGRSHGIVEFPDVILSSSFEKRLALLPEFRLWTK